MWNWLDGPEMAHPLVAGLLEGKTEVVLGAEFPAMDRRTHSKLVGLQPMGGFCVVLGPTTGGMRRGAVAGGHGGVNFFFRWYFLACLNSPLDSEHF